MKPLYTFVSILLSIFTSSLLSAFIISLMFFVLPAIFIVVIYCFIGTALLGAPVSFVIHMMVKSERLYAIFIKLVLHIAAAALFIMLFFIDEMNGQNILYSGAILFLISAVINAIIYFVIYTCIRRFLFNDRQAAPQ
ncbi:hypothetical protein [Paenibacillus sp. 2TAB19]|uniref:hypothetical protein n=1 Tax=Paenibacillus sp. 2TAB19 TaxID=3233003 RepID=UPI003F977696